MYIESIRLNNFRNYESLEMNFDQGTNILYGDNAQGKTNILEAVYLAGTSKSHKGSKDREMIRFENEESHIRMMVKKGGLSYKVDMHLRKNKAKGVAINGLPIRKARELLGVVNLVFFSPEDLNIIKNGPGERRRFLDSELCQLDSVYITELASYNHIVNQRNRLLKDCYMNPGLKSTLDIWDMQMAQYGENIIEKRKCFVEKINHVITETHGSITNGKENLQIRYEPGVKGNTLYDELKKNRDRDLRMGSTMAGPHRDDIGFYNHDIDIRRYGSQGQQRTAALSLKLSEIDLVKEAIKDVPVLLLDDVLSELDSSRQKQLLDNINGIQTMITCTGLDEFVENRFHIDSVYKVTNGTIERSRNE